MQGALSPGRCRRCGACCRTFPIFASEADAEREPRIRSEGLPLAEHLRTADYAYRLFRLPFHERCCFLGPDGGCGIYAARPRVCREFAPGGEQCREARRRCGAEPAAPEDLSSPPCA